MKILFKKGEWESKLQYAYTYRFPEKPLFKQEEDCLVNLPNPDMPHGYDYVTLMTREKYPLGTVFGATCSFHAYGAPLLVITDGLTRDETGAIYYENYYEVVLWEQGIHVWEMKTENKKVTWKKLMGASFPVEREALHSFWVELAPRGIVICVGDRQFYLRLEELSEENYLGITACEGENRFYEMKLALPEAEK